MSVESVSLLSSLDKEELTSLVRRVLQSPESQVRDWEVQPLHGGLEVGSAVYRLQGQAQARDGTVPWSLILKAVEPQSENSDPQGIWYDRREALAYQSGLLQRLPGKIRGPRCYGVQERPDGSVWLWLEDVEDEVGEAWPLAHYGEVARQLGEWSGAYLLGEPLPSEPWISRDWLRRYVAHAAPMIDFLRVNPGHPVVKSMYPGSTLAQMLAFWDEREHYLNVLDRLPQVFCHQDAFRRNLFARHDGTVAIDWGYAGMAAVGGELAALVFASLALFEVPASQARELDRVCFEGYMQGLRNTGWDGPTRQVRLGFTVTCLLRYVMGASVGETLPALLDVDGRSHYEMNMGRPAAEIERTDPELLAFLQGVVMEAFRLLGAGSLLRFGARTARYALTLHRGKS